jgi:hypothetical protein
MSLFSVFIGRAPATADGTRRLGPTRLTILLRGLLAVTPRRYVRSGKWKMGTFL